MLAENYNIQEVRGTKKKGAAKRRVKLQSLVYEMDKDINVSQQLPVQMKEVVVFVFPKSSLSPKIYFILSQK